MTLSYPLVSSCLSTRPAKSPQFMRKKHRRSAAELRPRSSWWLVEAEASRAHLVLVVAGGEACLRAAHHGSPGGACLHISRAPPAQFAMAGAELARAQLATAAMIELVHTQLEAELTPRTSRAPPAECGDPSRPSPPDLSWPSPPECAISTLPTSSTPVNSTRR
jgi:hypothetical protein